MKIKITEDSLQYDLDEWGEPIIQLTLKYDKNLSIKERIELISEIVEYLEKRQPEFDIEEQEKMNYQCPKCKGVLTPWSDKIHVCDVCGYGKDGDEYDILQQTKIPITNIINGDPQ